MSGDERARLSQIIRTPRLKVTLPLICFLGMLPAGMALILLSACSSIKKQPSRAATDLGNDSAQVATALTRLLHHQDISDASFIETLFRTRFTQVAHEDLTSGGLNMSTTSFISGSPLGRGTLGLNYEQDRELRISTKQKNATKYQDDCSTIEGKPRTLLRITGFDYTYPGPECVPASTIYPYRVVPDAGHLIREVDSGPSYALKLKWKYRIPPHCGLEITAVVDYDRPFCLFSLDIIQADPIEFN